jgi:hypothetical protein
VKQVEFNTIASSFGCLTSLLVDQHKYVHIKVDQHTHGALYTLAANILPF